VAALGAPSVASARPDRARATGPRELLVLDHGHTHRRAITGLGALSLPHTGPGGAARRSRAGAPAAAATTRPSASAARARSSLSTPAGALLALTRRGALSAADYRRYLGEYRLARRSLGRLGGTRRSELGAVLANVQAIAGAGGFLPSRLPALFLTLERNRQWWTSGPLLSDGQRVSFPGSRLVWQYYAGQGVEIQWLGTFGQANGLFQAGDDGGLRAVLDEAVPLASARAGGIAWEYLFRFDGGRPPWTSSLSQGTAIQALTRAAVRLREPAFSDAARRALGIFLIAPPMGVRIATRVGTHYLQYSFAPGERILNGFIQSLVGLYDYATLTGDPLGAQLFASGDAQGRVEVPSYDTGAWSQYDQHTESDLSYHELLRDFLLHLCQRTDPQGASTSAPSATAPPGQTSAPANADASYCTTAQRFTTYLKTRPVVSLLTHRVRGRRPTDVRVALSKVSRVTMTIRSTGHVVFVGSGQLGHGTPSLRWPSPGRPGPYTVTLSAVDLAGNRASTRAPVTVVAPAPVRRVSRVRHPTSRRR